MMKRCFLALPVSTLIFLAGSAIAQTTAAQSGNSAPVSYASVNQVAQLISPLEQTSQQTLTDLAGLRIDKWKTDSNTKRQTQSDVGSIERNLQSALPEMLTELKSSPEGLTQTFKVYRNLDALNDVFSGVVENAGAFGSKDEYQALGADLAAFEKSRRAMADRMEALASNKDSEIAQLRSQLRTAVAAEAAAPVKKTVVDDTEPAKKTEKRKTASKKTAKPSEAHKSTTQTSETSKKSAGSSASSTSQPPQQQ